jgi:hypothetical protein
MKHLAKTMSLVAALSALTVTSQAQIIVWNAGANFDSEPVGPYGSTTQFGGTSSPSLNIVTPGEGGSGNAMALQDGSFLNFQSAGASYAASGNTSANLSDYTLSFDLAVQGVDAGPYPQGFQISIFGPGGSVFSGPKLELDLTSTVFPAGQGYQHYSFGLNQFNLVNGFVPTASSYSVGFGIVSFGGANTPATPETMDFDNLEITMVPEPSTGALLVGGLGLLAGCRRFRRVS